MSARLTRLCIVALVALLQGFAPLLHDHVGGPRAGSGVHIHLGPSLAATDGSGAADRLQPGDPAGLEVGVGQLIERRDEHRCTPETDCDAAPPPPGLPQFAAFRASRSVDAAPPSPPQVARTLPPPALAPPRTGVG
jgi:hypothetical protein